MLYSKIIGTGSYLPEKVLTNDDMSKLVDTNDEWITTRTGIKQRHIAAEDEYTSDLGAKAAIDAIQSAGLLPENIDLIILGTTTPDNTFPSTAAKIQAKIKAFNSTAFDVQAVCSGFIYALTVADSFIKAGNAKTVLVIGAETMSRVIDWTDRSTCVLFGDGAGAVILQASNQDESSKPSGILSTIIKTDGRYYDALKTNSGPSMGNEKSYLQMSGKEVFKIATSKMPEVSLEAIKKANLSPSDVNWLVPHQANVRIIDAALKKISIPAENTAMTISEHANTSAASIPLAFDNFIKNNKIKHGDVILMTAMGAGFTWGSVVLRY